MTAHHLLAPDPSWFARDPLDVARGLLGAHLAVTDLGAVTGLGTGTAEGTAAEEGGAEESGAVVVRLTEVEAYHGSRDPGSHAFRGPTRRNATMFGPGGALYVYFTYGMHYCVNVVCGQQGEAAAVLLRAGEVVGGVDLARARRATARRDVDLARGPARLAAALGLSGTDDGTVIGGRRVRLKVPQPPLRTVRQGPRVGVAGPGGGADAFPWRFWLVDEPTVSPYRPALARRRPRTSTPVPQPAPGAAPGAPATDGAAD